MSAPRASRSLPPKPDLRHLKDEAKDLVRAGEAPTLAQAQLRLAREYGFASWPKLKAHIESLHEIGQLKAAIDTNDLVRVQELMTRNPALHRAPLGYGSNGPLTWVAECRVPREAPGEARLAMARWMIENGSDVHQGGDGPLMRAALDDMRLSMMELLLAYGADPNARWNGTYPIICAPCETLQPSALKLLIEHAADMRAASTQYGSCLGMLISTYGRNPEGKHACLEVFAQAGFPFPDAAPMAVQSTCWPRWSIENRRSCIDGSAKRKSIRRIWEESECTLPRSIAARFCKWPSSTRRYRSRNGSSSAAPT